MKRVILSLLLLTSTLGFATEANLESYEIGEGFCVAETLAIQAGKVIKKNDVIPDSIIVEAQMRSIDFYRAYSNLYTVCEGNLKAPQTCPLNLKTTLVKAESKLVFTSFYGIIVEVDMDGDEDHVFFYFRYDPNENTLGLTLAFHSEQSAAAFWVCEDRYNN